MSSGLSGSSSQDEEEPNEEEPNEEEPNEEEPNEEEPNEEELDETDSHEVLDIIGGTGIVHELNSRAGNARLFSPQQLSHTPTMQGIPEKFAEIQSELAADDRRLQNIYKAWKELDTAVDCEIEGVKLCVLNPGQSHVVVYFEGYAFVLRPVPDFRKAAWYFMAEQTKTTVLVLMVPPVPAEEKDVIKTQTDLLAKALKHIIDRNRYGVDISRLSIMGYSAGANLLLHVLCSLLGGIEQSGKKVNISAHLIAPLTSIEQITRRQRSQLNTAHYKIKKDPDCRTSLVLPNLNISKVVGHGSFGFYLLVCGLVNREYVLQERPFLDLLAANDDPNVNIKVTLHNLTLDPFSSQLAEVANKIDNERFCVIDHEYTHSAPWTSSKFQRELQSILSTEIDLDHPQTRRPRARSFDTQKHQKHETRIRSLSVGDAPSVLPPQQPPLPEATVAAVLPESIRHGSPLQGESSGIFSHFPNVGLLTPERKYKKEPNKPGKKFKRPLSGLTQDHIPRDKRIRREGVVQLGVFDSVSQGDPQEILPPCSFGRGLRHL